MLVVDDSRTMRLALIRALNGLGFRNITEAANGEMALQLAARTPPDLVLLDIMMPGMDGYEVCRRLRQMPETAEVPIMFLRRSRKCKTKRGASKRAQMITSPSPSKCSRSRPASAPCSKPRPTAMRSKNRSRANCGWPGKSRWACCPAISRRVEKAYGVEFSAVLEPAREVGGDLYGVCAAGPGRLVVFLGDVSGKGIPASMFMVRAISLAQLLAREIPEPERILARLNDELATDNPSGMFVTFLCAVFEPASGRLTLANGGHCRPVLLRAGAGSELDGAEPRHGPWL